MATPSTAATSPRSRGRGGGFRLTSYSPQFDFSYLTPQSVPKPSNVYKTFFENRKKSIGSRQKSFSAHLRNLTYSSHIVSKTSSQSSVIVDKISNSPAAMPSPAIPATTLTSISSPHKNAWTQVTNGVKVTPTSDSVNPVPTNNSFEVLSDVEHDADNESTDFGSTDPDTDMETPDPSKRKTKSTRKTKKNSKKSRRKSRKSSTASDSDDELPSRKSNKNKLSSTQKDLIDESDSAPPSMDHNPSPQDDDLQDSDKEAPQLKNSDIRQFMNSSQTTDSSKVITSVDNESPSPLEASNNASSSESSTSLADSPAPAVESICRKIMDRTFMLTPTTKASDINQLCRYEMISILGLWYRKEAKQNGYMLDESLESLRSNIFDLQNDMNDLSSAVRITPAHQEATQSRELKFRVNGSSSQENSSPITPTLDYNSSNRGGLAAVPEASDAEKLGMNVNMMMTRPISTDPFRPPSTDTKTVSTKVPLTQFTARFDLSTNNTSAINVPLITRQLFRIFKKADRTLRLLPWFPDENNDVSSVDQEDDIPVEESLIKQWVDNPRIVNSRLLFSMRVESIVDLKHIRDTFVPWMLKNNSRLKLDLLTAREIYGIGFIADVHPTFYNRSLLKEYLHAQLKKQNQHIQLNVYARTVWGTKDRKQLSCKAIVIEVDKQFKDIAASALMAITFPPRYRYAKFIPFDKTIIPDELLNTILISNNEYQATTRRKVISGLTDIDHLHDTLDGEQMSFRDWIMLQKNTSTGDFVFEHIEPSRQDVAIIYPSVYADTVRDFLNKITEHLRTTFKYPNDFLSTSATLNTRTSKTSDASIAYGKTIASLFTGNPQDPSPPPSKPAPKPKKIYYGAADSAPKTHYNHLTQSQKSTPPPVTPPKKQPPSAPSDHNNVLQRLEKLEKESTSNFEKITTRMDNKFRDLEAKREADQSKFLNTVTTVVTDSLASSIPQLIADQLKVAFQSGGEDI